VILRRCLIALSLVVLLSNSLLTPVNANESFTVHQIMQGNCTGSSVGSNIYVQENAFDFPVNATSGQNFEVQLNEGPNCNLISVEVNGRPVNQSTFEQVIPIEENGLVIGSIYINGTWDSETKLFTFLSLSDNVTIKGIFEYALDDSGSEVITDPVDPPASPQWDLDITVNGHFGISRSQIDIQVQGQSIDEAPNRFDQGEDISITLTPAIGWRIENLHIINSVDTDLSEYISNPDLWTDQGLPIVITDIQEDHVIAVHLIRDPLAIGEIVPEIFFMDLIIGETGSSINVSLNGEPINLNFVEKLKGRIEYFVWNEEHTIQVRNSCLLDSDGNQGLVPDWVVTTENSGVIEFTLSDLEVIQEQSGCEELSNAINLSSDVEHLPKLFISLWYESEGGYVRYLESSPVHIYFPPVINDPTELDVLELGERYKFNSSFRENIAYINLEIFEYTNVTQRFCFLQKSINHLEDFDEDGGIWVTLPTEEEVNGNCEEFTNYRLNANNSHEIFFWFTDENGDYSGQWNFDTPYLPLNVGAVDESSSGDENDAPGNGTENQEVVEIPRVRELTSVSTELSEVDEEVIEVEEPKEVVLNEIELADEKSISKESLPNWCKKLGIWIYTVSGKLRICDPEKKTGIEMKACAGKEETPTYPWIFKPQKFVSGVSKSKSGISLANAIFFYKGLAISGAEKIPDERCSRGSVFIPNQYSKQVFKFAKQKRPTIWVKES
jgi:hypothetical protein